MSKYTRNKAKTAKKKSDKKWEAEGIKYYARCTCGCCDTDPMYFSSEKSILEAFETLGLTSSGTIIDDKGTVHREIDTFYGYWK